jgi:hypothetical protein
LLPRRAFVFKNRSFQSSRGVSLRDIQLKKKDGYFPIRLKKFYNRSSGSRDATSPMLAS